MSDKIRDDESCFGFHSEYYVYYTRMRKICYGNEGWNGEAGACRGYMRYAKYGDEIYFLPDKAGNHIIKCNPMEKKLGVIPLNTKEKFGFFDAYIAVNRRGYFLYNRQSITLFGFEGQEIYTYRLWQKSGNRQSECIYIYDSIVTYSKTGETGIRSEILWIDMITGESGCLWRSQKGDSYFDRMLRQGYEEERGMELPFFPAPSNVGDVTCEFLYRNKNRVVAGYQRGKAGNWISYIVNIDLVTGKYSILDSFAVGDAKYTLPTENERGIFSFDMLDDTMWVKVEGRDIRLVHTDIQRISQLQGRYVVEWKLHPCGGEYYYFNGSRAYIPGQGGLCRLDRAGGEEKIWGHLYATRRFYCFDNVCTIPLTYEPIQFCDLEGSLVYSLEEQKIEFVVEFADNFKEQPGEQAGGQVKEQSKGTGITLAEFRRNAPEAVGLRESLLSYRKSLENMWDYNAYVGILLGVGGSKHGDAACSNYAIGQGDNGNNTKRTLEAKGLTEVFEKYKGKRTDETILLSDVEDEIVVIAPEYKKIRKNFHEIMEGRIYG